MTPEILGIDTGNRCVKTVSQIIVAGVRVSDAPSTIFQDNDTIEYNGKYYTLTDDRNSYKRKKSIDDDYFVMSLFAAVRELKDRGIDVTKTNDPTKVILVVGLPPAHHAMQKDTFRDYFNRGVVRFEYNGDPAALDIVNVHVLIQGYAAIFNKYKEVRELEDAYIVDIGGYTTDVIEIRRGRTNQSTCFSEDAGMIHIYNAIKDEMNMRFESVPKESQIDRLLSDKDYGDKQLEPGMKKVAIDKAESYINELLLHLREKGVDLRLNTGIFVGGGSARLQDLISKSDLVRNPIFVTDVRANANGYETIVKHKYQQKNGGEK